MKVSQLIKNLQKIMEENGDLQIVYSADDEVNWYQKVYYNPRAGWYEGDEFLGRELIDLMVKDGEAEPDDYPINAICIN